MKFTRIAASLLVFSLPSPAFAQKSVTARLPPRTGGVRASHAPRPVDFAGSVTPWSQRSGSRALIGLVDNSEFRYRDGCGCSLFPPARGRNSRHHYYLLTELGSALGKRAWMNIEGRTVPLSLLSTTRPSGQERKGSRFTEVYRGGGATARITYVVARPTMPGGEVTQYSATITVRKGDQIQTVRATGDCGC